MTAPSPSRRCWPLLVALSGALAGCAFRAEPGEPPLVGEIEVIGNKALTTDEIVDKLAITESGFRFVIRIGDGFEFDSEALKADVRRIERFYLASGFFQARVTDVRTEEKKGRVDVTFVVEEGPASPVTSLLISGLEGVAGDLRADVVRDLPLRKGVRFREEDYDLAKARIRERLRGLGYAEASVGGTVTVNREASTVEIAIEVGPGLRYTISRVHAYGTQNVNRSRVIEASRIKEGELYTPQLLAVAQRRIYGLGVFSVVQVDPGPFNRKEAQIPVIITVTEAPFVTVEGGVGVEADPTRQLAQGRVGATHRNLWNGLQKGKISGAVGYAFLPSLLDFLSQAESPNSGLVGNVRTELSQPRILRSPFDGYVGFDYDKDVTLPFRFQRLAARTGVLWHPDVLPEFTLSPSLNYEYYFDVSLPGGQAPSTSGLVTSGCGATRAGVVPTTCNVFYAELRASLDFRDDQLSAHRGIFFSVGLQYSGTPLSDFNYFRLAPELRGYVPVSRSLTLSARVRYGLLASLGGSRDPPGVARFFAGGATSVRTASAEQLGPRGYRIETSGNAFIAGVPVPLGGERLVEGSLELRWVTGWAGLALGLFFDVGALDNSNRFLPQSGYQAGPGLGLRYHTPFGPLRVDVAYRLQKLDVLSPVTQAPTTFPITTPPQEFRIRYDCDGFTAPTCYQDGPWEVFLTLGEAF